MCWRYEGASEALVRMSWLCGYGRVVDVISVELECVDVVVMMF